MLSFNEPIPDYTTRNNALLESALGSPKQTFDGKLLYPTLIDQATVLFYSLIKNHPFENGNKRIAVIALLVFLRLNGKWPVMSQEDLYNIAVLVSNSNSQKKDEVMSIIYLLLQNTVHDYPIK